METLDPDDHMTMSHLEGQLKAARGVARGCKAPSVAMEEALVALADAKVKMESSTRHLATAQDHHNRASADVARCREEYKAAKLMNVAPLQHQHHTEKASMAATDMAVTLEKLKSTAQFGSSGSVVVNPALLQLLTGQIMKLSGGTVPSRELGSTEMLGHSQGLVTGRFNFNSENSSPSSFAKRRRRARTDLVVIHSGEEDAVFEDDFSDHVLAERLQHSAAEHETSVCDDGYSSLPESLGSILKTPITTPLAKFRKGHGSNQFRTALPVPVLRLRGKTGSVLRKEFKHKRTTLARAPNAAATP